MEKLTAVEVAKGKELGILKEKIKTYTYNKVWYDDNGKRCVSKIVKSRIVNPLINPNKAKKNKQKTYYVTDLLAFTLWKKLGRTADQINNPYYAQFLQGKYIDSGKIMNELSKNSLMVSNYMAIEHEEKDC